MVHCAYNQATVLLKSADLFLCDQPQPPLAVFSIYTTQLVGFTYDCACVALPFSLLSGCKLSYFDVMKSIF